MSVQGNTDQDIPVFKECQLQQKEDVYNSLEIGPGTGMFSKEFRSWRLNYFLEILPDVENKIRRRFPPLHQKNLKFFRTRRQSVQTYHKAVATSYSVGTRSYSSHRDTYNSTCMTSREFLYQVVIVSYSMLTAIMIMTYTKQNVVIGTTTPNCND